MNQELFQVIRSMVAQNWPETIAVEVTIELANGRKVTLPISNVTAATPSAATSSASLATSPSQSGTLATLGAKGTLAGVDWEVLLFLKDAKEPFVAKEIVKHLEASGQIFGTSTIERALARLVNAGMIYNIYSQGYKVVLERLPPELLPRPRADLR